MTCYVANHRKKKRILAKREATLRRLIDAGADKPKVVTAAESVREARIRVLRVKRSVIVPTGDALNRYAEVDESISRLATLPVANIFGEFGYRR